MMRNLLTAMMVYTHATPDAEYASKQIAGNGQPGDGGTAEDLRTAVTLREIEGLSYEEIAEAMDCRSERCAAASSGRERRLRPNCDRCWEHGRQEMVGDERQYGRVRARLTCRLVTREQIRAGSTATLHRMRSSWLAIPCQNRMVAIAGPKCTLWVTASAVWKARRKAAPIVFARSRRSLRSLHRWLVRPARRAKRQNTSSVA